MNLARGLVKIREFYKLHNYEVAEGKNGRKYVPFKTVANDHTNLSMKNSKTGKVIAFNLPVELTCRHDCECYSTRACYACNGCYQFSNNQVIYSENLAFFLTHNNSEFVAEIVRQVKKARSRILFRWFTCGDIVNRRFLEAMIDIARQCPEVTFWTYTKKYSIVNSFVEECGLDAIPDNLTIIYSHWMNEDGTYLEMDNRYSFPTSEFIPMGKEELLNTVTHVCPCSDPTKNEHCQNCKTPCYKLQYGESMALIEHSTERTKARDNVIKAMKKAGKTIDSLIDFLKSF